MNRSRVANACAGSDMTRSLLSALGRSGEVRPLFADDLDVTTLTASSDVFYKAMIDAFADGVVTRLDE